MLLSRMKSLLGLALLACAEMAIAHGDTLRVTDAWISEAPPGATMLAGYLTLENLGRETHNITAIRSSSGAEVMMHLTEIVDGVAKMRHLDALTIPPGGRIVFEPGGYHLMIMGAPPLKAGDHLDLQIVTDHGDALEVQAEVRRPSD
jgi:periplasmic copper chaperone A